ncbi:MAG TPA: hypothetical protein VHH94_04660 [Gammaproteobacteria bacterium]|nr:hypothetical protein [Gammaproteobacteria bacterium]
MISASNPSPCRLLVLVSNRPEINSLVSHFGYLIGLSAAHVLIMKDHPDAGLQLIPQVGQQL